MRLFGSIFSRRTLLATLLLVGLSACATSSGTSRERTRGDIITLEELQELGRLNALQAIQRLQPQWLRVRGVDSIYSSNEVVIYVDGIRRGGPEALRTIQTVNLQEIRHLDSRQATTQLGGGHPSGAILIITRRP